MAQPNGHLRRAEDVSAAEEVHVADRAKSPSATSTEHAKGSVKEAIGKLTGDVRVEAEGKAQKRRARPPKTAPRGD
jgi:hypothetical protein